MKPIFGTGRNSKVPYYARNFVRYALPRFPYRARLRGVINSVSGRSDRDQILDRLEYYNRLDQPALLPDDAPRIGDLRPGRKLTVYFFDAFEFTRWFDPRLRWNYLFGDVTRVPPYPTIVKSRPIHGDNRNSVLLNLDKVRHFVFLNDRRPFADKQDRAIFRGSTAGKPHRRKFMEMFHGHPLCDARVVGDRTGVPESWKGGKKISLWDHLNFKFVMSLEGYDVASNLKWVMSSNSVAVMPRPKYETWFMEGRLRPEHHYIEIRSDYTDLEEKLRYYLAHPEEAERISRNAQTYVKQFFDRGRETLISLLVLQQYFRLTSPIATPSPAG